MPPPTPDPGDEARPARFGPFYRKESPTQTVAVAAEQHTNGQIWGRTAPGGLVPQVQAYVGHLPEGVRGIEFYTDIPPDPGGPPRRVSWTGGHRRRDVRTDGDFAIIDCIVTVNTQAAPNE